MVALCQQWSSRWASQVELQLTSSFQTAAASSYRKTLSERWEDAPDGAASPLTLGPDSHRTPVEGETATADL